MPRLLILCEYPTLLGGERSMLATLPATAAAGFEIEVAAPPTGRLADELKARGIPHLPWQAYDAVGQRLPLQNLRDDVAAVVCRARPNLLHANSLAAARIAGPVAVDRNVRSIGHLRDILKLPQQQINDLNLHYRLIAVSGATRDFHVAQGILPAKCVVLHNGVDLNEISPRPATKYLHRELDLPSDIRFAAIIGQLGLRKGTDVALTAALQIAEEFSDLHWLIVGERTSIKDESRDFELLLRSIADETPLAGRVHFVGNRTDVPRLLNECDVLVHAARQEPLGRVLLEAAASAVAVIATDVGGTREIFSDHANAAILIPPDSAFALANALREILKDDFRREQLAAAARARAEAAFDIRDAAKRIVEQYQSVFA